VLDSHRREVAQLSHDRAGSRKFGFGRQATQDCEELVQDLGNFQDVDLNTASENRVYHSTGREDRDNDGGLDVS
jgi:hypothetical protein